MNATREEAKKVAESLPVGFGLIEISMLISIIYYAYQLWKACYDSNATGYALGSDGKHSPTITRLARRRVKIAARHHGYKLSKDDLDTLTLAALDHAANLPASRFSACCAEPYVAELQAVGNVVEDDD